MSNMILRVDQTGELVRTEVVDAYVGNRLRARRIEVGFTQVALAGHLGLSFSQVQKYEKGSNRIGAGQLYRLALLLGVPLQYFFEGHEVSGSSQATREALSTEAARFYEMFLMIPNPDTRQALVSLAFSIARVDARRVPRRDA